MNIKFMDAAYDHDEFLDYIKGFEGEREGGERCRKCFELRLSKTFEAALKNGFDYFATTLTVSPHKNAVIINEVGEKLSSEKTVWLYSDFKKKDGYKKSIELSKQYELYRQNYCGCEFSIY